jgi:hypothetical protein
MLQRSNDAVHEKKTVWWIEPTTSTGYMFRPSASLA